MKFPILSLIIFLALFSYSLLAVDVESKQDVKDKLFTLNCFIHLNGNKPTPAQFKSLTRHKSGLKNCLNLIDDISLNKKSHIPILETLLRFHSTWFGANDFVRIDLHHFANDIYDSQHMGSALTYNLLKESNISSLFKGTDTYSVLRQSNKEQDVSSVEGASGRIRVKKDVIWTTNKKDKKWTPNFIPRGKLKTIQKIGKSDKLVPASTGTQGRRNKAKIASPLTPHLGGGILGTPEYVLLNVKYDEFDGGIMHYRRYGANLVKQFMCRNIPVLNKSDVIKHVDKSHYIEFKTKKECMSCHSTIDEIGTLLGHVKVVDNEEDGEKMGVFPFLEIGDKPYSSIFNYRELNNTLHEIEVKNLKQLGQQILNIYDFYMCFASRYYQFVTGRKVEIENLALKESVDYQNVDKLAQKFKRHKNLKQLLKDTYSLRYEQGI
jgi:hypothetical protein